MSAPRIVLTGPMDRPGSMWRIVACELPDEHGVVRTCHVIETTEAKLKDAMGVQRWEEMHGKRGMSDWVTLALRLKDELLKRAGETPDEPQ